MGDGVVQIHSISIHSLRMEGDSPMRDCWIPLCLFQSTPSAWRETSHTVTAKLAVGKFQSTPSAWRETVSFPPSLGVDSYFNPLPPHGGRRCCQRQFSRIIYFNPLPPHGGRHIPDAEDTKQNHFNPLPPHGGRRCILRRPSSNRGISIHSLRMEGDFRVAPSLHQAIISIHSLRMEGDA